MKISGKFVKRALFLGVLIFILVFLIRNATLLSEHEFRISVKHIAGSVFLALTAYLLGIRTWARIANQCGVRARWLEHAKVWSISRLGRYVPGKIAVIYMRIGGYKGQSAKAGASLYVETTSSLIAICGFVLTCWVLGVVTLTSLHLSLTTAALLIVTALSSRHLLAALSRSVSAVGKLVRPDNLPTYRWWLGTVLLQVGVMLLHGGSLYLVVSSLTNLEPGYFLELTVYYYFAGLAGMLSLFAPAGLGVREVVLASFLQTLVPLPVAVVSVTVVRLVSLASECALAAFFYFFSARIIRLCDRSAK